MCGRFALATEKHILEMLFQLEIRMELEPRHNIAPGGDVLAVRLNPGGYRESALLKWGLVPHWSKDKSIGRKMINARSETVTGKPAFRDAFHRRRALVPASAFYEWQKTGEGKQPFLISLKDGRPLALAAIWESWTQETAPLESCAILTTRPNNLLAPIHDRMPVIIHEEAYQIWLDPQAGAQELMPLLEPFDPALLRAVPAAAALFM